MFPLLRSSRSFFTRLNPPLPWKSALVIYNLEPFHFLCNYETADNPARFIIWSCRCSFPLSPSPSRSTKLRTQKRHRIALVPAFSMRGRLSPRRDCKKRRSQMGHGRHKGEGFAFILPLEQEFTLMIRLDLVINTPHGAKVLKKMLDMFLYACVNYRIVMVW